MRQQSTPRHLRRAAIGTLSAALPALLLTGLARAQVEEWEWEPDEGYHSEEWYDPSDWFNEDDRVSYESDWDDWAYDDGYDDYDDAWYDDGYAYGYDDYGWHYDYDPVTDRWDYEYGYHDDRYASDWYEGTDYGWHYVWDSDTSSWDSQYGWHDQQYVYESDRNRQQGQQQRDRQDRQANRQDDRRDRYADQNRYGDRQRRDRQARSEGMRSSQRQGMRSQRDEAKFSGRIEDFERVSLEGQRDPHTLVRLRMRDGRSRIVNLGPRTGPDQLDIDSGDQVTVRGRRGSISGRDVLMANAIRVDGDRTKLRRDAQRRHEQHQRDQQRRQGRNDDRSWSSDEDDQSRKQGSDQRARTVTFKGRLDGFKKMKDPDGGHEDHLYVRMRLRDGSRRVIDLGPSVDMGNLDLSHGDRVIVRGCPKTVDGNQFLVADRLRIEGDRVPLERKGSSSDDDYGQKSGM